MRLALVGYGRMGRAVEAVALQRGHDVVARVERGDELAAGLRDAEVAVDFTVPDAVLDTVRGAAAAGVPLVVGTTGWYDRTEDVRRIVEASGTGLLWAPNFSMGVQLFFRLAREAGRLVDALEEYDVSLHEAHHRHKLDHPSGTGRRLADLLVEALARKERWEEGPFEGAPDPAVLEVTSSRAGEVPGTHVVALDGPDDRVELRHEARGRDGFARGAVLAAEWLRGRTGFHDIDDMLAERFDAGR
ncbi:MAG: 4-hydroxy-tetrahydrodipicolinate reductase [Gemmatimonadetes bacterium]|nr:4-hydroxy-tetrahydrodipicolinate reductase [Gemmatimonadota bacterium]